MVGDERGRREGGFLKEEEGRGDDNCYETNTPLSKQGTPPDLLATNSEPTLRDEG